MSHKLDAHYLQHVAPWIFTSRSSHVTTFLGYIRQRGVVLPRSTNMGRFEITLILSALIGNLVTSDEVCLHHESVPAMLIQHQVARLQSVLRPIETAALTLSTIERAPVKIRTRLAHAFLEVHDAFSATCYDHEWFDALAHKLCKVYIRFEKTLKSFCSSLQGADHDNVVLCLCLELKSVHRACKNHVLPWTGEHAVCSRVLSTEGCRSLSPVAGVCLHDKKTKSPRRVSAVRLPVLSHAKHSSAPKHNGWTAQARDEKTRRWSTDMTNQATKQQMSATGRTTKRPTPRNPGRTPLSANKVIDQESLKIALLIPKRAGFSARSISNTHPPPTLCVPTSHRSPTPSLLRVIYPTLPARGILPMPGGVDGAVAALLNESRCDAVALWASSAELVYLHPCTIPAIRASHPHYCKSKGRAAYALRIFHDPARNQVHLSGVSAAPKHQRRDSAATRQACHRTRAGSHHGMVPGGSSSVLAAVCQTKQVRSREVATPSVLGMLGS